MFKIVVFDIHIMSRNEMMAFEMCVEKRREVDGKGEKKQQIRFFIELIKSNDMYKKRAS